MKTDLESLKALARTLDRDPRCDCDHCKIALMIDDIIADLESLKTLEPSKWDH